MKTKSCSSAIIITILFILTTTVFATTQPIPDTGISKCYNDTAEIPCSTAGQDFYGQDANYSINPMSYTKLDATGNALLGGYSFRLETTNNDRAWFNSGFQRSVSLTNY